MCTDRIQISNHFVTDDACPYHFVFGELIIKAFRKIAAVVAAAE